MATIIQTTITVGNAGKAVQAAVTSDEIPTDVFIYENTGTTSLGTYVGVVNFRDYTRIQSWNGTAVPIFGNKYVKHTVANFVRLLTVSNDAISDKLEADLRTFKQEYLTQGSVTKTTTI